MKESRRYLLHKPPCMITPQEWLTTNLLLQVPLSWAFLTLPQQWEGGSNPNPGSTQLRRIWSSVRKVCFWQERSCRSPRHPRSAKLPARTILGVCWCFAARLVKRHVRYITHGLGRIYGCRHIILPSPGSPKQGCFGGGEGGQPPPGDTRRCSPGLPQPCGRGASERLIFSSIFRHSPQL